MGIEFTEFDRKTLRPAEGWLDQRVRPIDLKPLRIRNPLRHYNKELTIWPCAPGAVWDLAHGHRVIPKCNKWECKHCGEHRKAGLLAEIETVRQRHQGRMVFTVLTFSHDNRRVRNYRTNATLSETSQRQYYRRFTVRARRLLETNAYVMIPEWTKAGVIHFNILWMGVRRSYRDCESINRRTRNMDIRNACGKCTGCKLRTIWRQITGAPRSTHSIVRGNAAGYVAKYTTKETMQQTNRKDRTKRARRYSFSQGCKRDPNIMPVYRAESMRRMDNGSWEFGKKESPDDIPGRDYLTPMMFWLGAQSKFQAGGAPPEEGDTIERTMCEHEECRPTIYASRSRVKAWGGMAKIWECIMILYGAEAVELGRERLSRAVWTYEQRAPAHAKYLNRKLAEKRRNRKPKHRSAWGIRVKRNGRMDAKRERQQSTGNNGRELGLHDIASDTDRNQFTGQDGKAGPALQQVLRGRPRALHTESETREGLLDATRGRERRSDGGSNGDNRAGDQDRPSDEHVRLQPTQRE